MKLTIKQAADFVIEKLAYLEVPREDAKKTAEVLIEAELRDDPSHGISCLLSVLKSVKKREIIAGKKPEIITEKNAMAILNGENILGPVSGIMATEIAMQKAKEYGLSAISVR